MTRTLFGVMLALWVALGSLPAHADDSNHLTRLKISVWLEYDQPTVLVMLDGTLADQAPLPRTVSTLIPSRTTGLMTPWANPDGTLAREHAWQARDLGDGYARVTFSVAQPNYHVEYYHDARRGAPDKTFDFAFRALALAEQVTLEFQQPQATHFEVTPATPATRNDGNGFQSFILQYPNVNAGQTITAQAKYTKTDPTLNAADNFCPRGGTPQRRGV